eukprot:scaffold30460_cov24-Tisochrysis_lutea.AAC.1
MGRACRRWRGDGWSRRRDRRGDRISVVFYGGRCHEAARNSAEGISLMVERGGAAAARGEIDVLIRRAGGRPRGGRAPAISEQLLRLLS